MDYTQSPLHTVVNTGGVSLRTVILDQIVYHVNACGGNDALHDLRMCSVPFMLVELHGLNPTVGAGKLLLKKVKIESVYSLSLSDIDLLILYETVVQLHALKDVTMD